MALVIRRDLLWDYDVPDDPERDEAFMRLYVGRVLDRGTADDVRALGVDVIRRHLDKAPARREVIEFWRWYLGRVGGPDDDPHRSAATLPPNGGVRSPRSP